MGLTKPRAAQIYNLDYKQSTRVVTVTNITVAGGAPSSVDGVNLSVNDRVLVAGQSTASQNGLYYVATVGSGSNGTWARTSDGNETGEIESGMIVMVTEGATYADTQWKLTTDDPITIGSTALIFTQNYSANSIAGGSSNVTVFSNANVALSSAGTPNVLIVSSTGTVTSGTASITGNVTGGNVLTGGLISAIGDITGANLTVSGNIMPTANNVYALGSPTMVFQHLYVGPNSMYIGGAPLSTVDDGVSLLFNGEPIVTANTDGTSTTYGNMVIVGNITGTNLITNSGNITGNYLFANIAFATGYTASKIYNGTSEANIGTSGGNANISIGGTSNVVVFADTGEYVTGLISASGNVTGNNVVATALLTNGEITIVGANIISAGTNIYIDPNGTGGTDGNVIVTGNLSVLGNVTYISSNNITTNDLTINVANNASTASQADGGGIGVGPAGSEYISLTYNSTSNIWVATNGLLSQGILSATGNVTGGNLITGAQVVATGNITGSNIITAGQVVATGNVSGSTLIASGNIVVQSRQQVKFYDTDNSNFISFRAPNALTGDYLLTLPTGYGNADQVLSTNGAGSLAWVDQTGGNGGGSATSYPNSTVSPVPGATGNFDLSYDFVQTSQETPFESSATDAFGVNLGEVYSMMDPGGEVLEPVDLGLLT